MFFQGLGHRLNLAGRRGESGLAVGPVHALFMLPELMLALGRNEYALGLVLPQIVIGQVPHLEDVVYRPLPRCR
jgi:hypothetical protein